MNSITAALPEITTHPNKNGSITAAENSDVTLRCTATGDGTLNYQWRRVSGSLPSNSRINNGTLTIPNIAVNGSGEYYCEVDNGGDSVSSMRVQVTARSKSLMHQTIYINCVKLIKKQGDPLSVDSLVIKC